MISSKSKLVFLVEALQGNTNVSLSLILDISSNFNTTNVPQSPNSANNTSSRSSNSYDGV